MDNKQKYLTLKSFNYIKASNPNNSLKEKIKYFFILNNKLLSRTSYYNDAVCLLDEQKFDLFKRLQLKKYLSFFSYFDNIIYSFMVFSLYNHHSKGYFKIKSRLVDFYLLIKFSFYLYFLYSIKFFIFKSLSDPIMYDFYSEKEYTTSISIQDKRNMSDYYREQSSKRFDQVVNAK